MLKGKWKGMPKLPLTALVFYLVILVLSSFGIIPGIDDILSILQSLYNSYGVIGLFFVVFLEGIVYLGLYFPGSIIVAFVILLSDGSLSTFFSISIIVSLALTITSLINYVLGRHLIDRSIEKEKYFKEFEKSRKGNIATKGLFLSMIHPVPMAFYFLDSGLNEKSTLKILWVPIIMIPYTILISYLLYSFSSFFGGIFENHYFILALILIWIVASFFIENGRNRKVLKKVVRNF